MKLAAVAVNIFLTLLTGLVWQIAFWTVNLLDNKRIALLHNFKRSAGGISNLNLMLPIEKTGRLRHGQNTCFIAAAV